MIEHTDFTKSEQYTLSIRLSTDGFSFFLFNPLSEYEGEVYDFDIDESLSLTANLKSAFKDITWLSNTFRAVHILIAGSRMTFMPLELFEDEQADLIFYHNHPSRENESVLYNILPKSNIVVLFGMNKSAKHFLSEKFPEATFHAQSSPLIEYFSSKSSLGNSQKLYVYLHRNSIDVYAFKRTRLQLANSYPCKELSDQIYYLLYVWKQLEMDQERDELHLTGYFSHKEELLTELKKYIRQIFIMNPATNLDFKAITLCE